MSLDNFNNNKENKIIINKHIFTNILFNSLSDIEQKSKDLLVKNIGIKDNIRSIKLKERKIDKINQNILNKKEELKLLKELFLLKEEKNMNIKDIMDSYIDFLISSNDILDNKLNVLFQKEININPKKKYINKILGKDKIENDYDYIYENINKPIDVTKFLINPKNKNKKNNNSRRITENGGSKDNMDGYIINKKESDKSNDIHYSSNKNNYNNINLYQRKKNKISSSSSYEKISNGIKIEEIPKSFNYKNNNKKNSNTKINIHSNTKPLKKINENKKYEKFISPQNTNNKNTNYKINLFIENSDKKPDYIIDMLNEDKYNINDSDINFRNVNKVVKNFSKTDINYFGNYNLNPNKKLKKAREIFQRLLNKLKNSNQLYFTNNNNKNLKHFFKNVLKTKYFLRKVLSIIFECCEIYNPNNKITITETIHDSEFLSRLNNYESDDNFKNDIEGIKNIKIFEKGLEEIKKVTKETKLLQDKISQFVYKINVEG